MKITKENFQAAARKHEVPEETTEKIWQDLEQTASSGLNIPNLAYYLGALVVISAMGWFLNKAWDDASGLEITLLGQCHFRKALIAFLFFFPSKFRWQRG